MVKKGDIWSKRETQKLKNKWPDNTAEEIAEMLPGRTVEAVESKAQRLRENGDLPEKNRSTSSRSGYSTSQKQVEKGGSQIQQISGEITEVKRDSPRSMGTSNGIGLKINGEWFYDFFSPSRFKETGKGIAFQTGGDLFTVKGTRLSEADYTVEDSGSGQSYNRLQSYGTIQQGNATEISQTKEVEVKKSQLFEDFHQHQLSRSSGKRESFVLQVWENKDEVNEKWMSPGEHYPQNGPITGLGYRDLVEMSEMPRGFRDSPYHLSENDVRRDVVENVNDIDSKEEVNQAGLRTNLEVTNAEFLTALWSQRKEEVEIEHPRYNQIAIDWKNDTSAEAFLEKKFDFY